MSVSGIFTSGDRLSGGIFPRKRASSPSRAAYQLSYNDRQHEQRAQRRVSPQGEKYVELAVLFAFNRVDRFYEVLPRRDLHMLLHVANDLFV